MPCERQCRCLTSPHVSPPTHARSYGPTVPTAMEECSGAKEKDTRNNELDVGGVQHNANASTHGLRGLQTRKHADAAGQRSQVQSTPTKPGCTVRGSHQVRPELRLHDAAVAVLLHHPPPDHPCLRPQQVPPVSTPALPTATLEGGSRPQAASQSRSAPSSPCPAPSPSRSGQCTRTQRAATAKPPERAARQRPGQTVDARARCGPQQAGEAGTHLAEVELSVVRRVNALDLEQRCVVDLRVFGTLVAHNDATGVETGRAAHRQRQWAQHGGEGGGGRVPELSGARRRPSCASARPPALALPSIPSPAPRPPNALHKPCRRVWRRSPRASRHRRRTKAGSAASLASIRWPRRRSGGRFTAAAEFPGAPIFQTLEDETLTERH